MCTERVHGLCVNSQMVQKGGAEGIRKGYGRGEVEKVGRAGTCDTLMPCNVFGLCPEDPCNSDDQIYTLESSLFMQSGEWILAAQN